MSGLVWHYRAKRYLLPGWLWYLGTMLPVIGISQAGRQGMADRYAYIPFLGLFVIAVWTVADATATRGWRREVLAGIALAVVAAYAAISHVQLGYWRNSYTLFSHAVQVTTSNGVAENNLAIALDHDMGRPDLAMAHYEAAALDAPQWFTGHYNYGVVLERQGRLGEAMSQYQQALPYATDRDEASEAYNNLGAIMVQLDRPQDAVSQFSAIIGMNPGNGLALLNRGMVEYDQKSLDAAQADILQAVRLMPNPKTYFWLGRVLEQRGELKTAESAYQTALNMAPGTADIQNRLDLVRQKLRAEKTSSREGSLPVLSSVTQGVHRPLGSE
jgi:tetratricopeptide (TPR) repeat protein